MAPRISQADQAAAHGTSEVAVCLTGNARSLSHTAPNIERYLLAPLRATSQAVRFFAVVSAEDRRKPGLNQSDELNATPQYVRRIIAHKLNGEPTSVVTETDPPVTVNEHCELETSSYMAARAQLLRWLGQWSKVERCFGLVIAAERAQARRFSHVIRVRTDLYFLSAINWPDIHAAVEGRARVAIPRGISYSWINDHFAVRS